VRLINTLTYLLTYLILIGPSTLLFRHKVVTLEAMTAWVCGYVITLTYQVKQVTYKCRLRNCLSVRRFHVSSAPLGSEFQTVGAE